MDARNPSSQTAGSATDPTIGASTRATSGAQPQDTAEQGASGFIERRRRPTPMLSRYSFVEGRRATNSTGSASGGSSGGAGEGYVDVYDLRTVLLVLVFFALTVFDAIATVYYIDHVHGSEWNPIADWLLRHGRMVFVLGKGFPTALLLLFVLVHKNYRYGRVALTVGFAFYFLLAIYHVTLQVMAILFELGLLRAD